MKMQNLSLPDNNSQPFAVDNSLSFNFNNSTASNPSTFLSLIETKSYIPISCCIFEHILTTNNLTNHEKLYYLLADSLALISKNNGKHRSAAIPSEDWALRLGCSRSLIFTMQKSLEKKGYFIINKDLDERGRNKRNLIIPTLPPSIFYHLNEKSPDRTENLSPYNPLTECRRGFLDRTKLFIKLNYQLLLTITASFQLNPKQKMVWLSFYTRCYKNYILERREDYYIKPYTDQDDSTDSSFSFITSYQELADTYFCTTKHLAKSIKVLEKLDFIKTQHFYSRKKYSNDNYYRAQERQDQSLWKITISLPNDCILELKKTKNRSTLTIDNDTLTNNIIESKTDLIEDCLTPACTKFKLNSAHVSSSKSVSNYLNTTLSSPTICIDSVTKQQKKQDNVTLHNNTYSTALLPVRAFDNKIKEEGGIKSDPQVAKFRPLLNKNLKTNNIINRSTTENSHLSNVRSNFYKNSLKEGKLEQATNQPTLDKTQENKNTNTTKIKGKIKDIFTKAKALKDFYPLTKEDCETLQISSKREFSLRAMNEILLDMSKRLSNRIFKSKKAFINYMSKAFAGEMRDAVKTNNESFKIRNNKTKEEIALKEKEEFLSNIEYNLQTSSEWHLKKKIAALFDTSKSYELLRSFRSITQEGSIRTLHLDKYVELTDLDKEIILDQVRASYESIDFENEELGFIEKLEIVMPQKVHEWQETGSNKKEESLILPENIWGRVRKKLITIYGEAMDRAWFSKLLVSNIDEETKKVELKAPTNFIASWIQQNYLHVIERIFKNDHYKMEFAERI